MAKGCSARYRSIATKPPQLAEAHDLDLVRTLIPRPYALHPEPYNTVDGQNPALPIIRNIP